MPNRKLPGRRRAPKAPLRRRITTVLTPQVAMKSMAALGVVGAATASVVLPASGSASAPVVLSTPTNAAASSALAEARTTAILGASRASMRPTLGENNSESADKAVAAPPAAAPTVTGTVGVAGFEAVAKPAPETNLDKVGGAAAAAAQSSANPGAAAPANTGASVYVGAGYSMGDFAGWCSSLGLSHNATGVCSAVRSLFGISNIGGFRAGDWGDHGTGNAVDVMTSDFAQGDAVAAFLQEHAGEFGIKYLIWKQQYWAPGGGWSMMEDRGSPTQNHYDHVHVSVY